VLSGLELAHGKGGTFEWHVCFKGLLLWAYQKTVTRVPGRTPLWKGLSYCNDAGRSCRVRACLLFQHLHLRCQTYLGAMRLCVICTHHTPIYHVPAYYCFSHLCFWSLYCTGVASYVCSSHVISRQLGGFYLACSVISRPACVVQDSHACTQGDCRSAADVPLGEACKPLMPTLLCGKSVAACLRRHASTHKS
jgi:hypothetical protein